jgi:hypothetical protein
MRAKIRIGDWQGAGVEGFGDFELNATQSQRFKGPRTRTAPPAQSTGEADPKKKKKKKDSAFYGMVPFGCVWSVGFVLFVCCVVVADHISYNRCLPIDHSPNNHRYQTVFGRELCEGKETRKRTERGVCVSCRRWVGWLVGFGNSGGGGFVCVFFLRVGWPVKSHSHPFQHRLGRRGHVRFANGKPWAVAPLQVEICLYRLGDNLPSQAPGGCGSQGSRRRALR